MYLGVEGFGLAGSRACVGDASKHFALSQPRFDLSAPTDEITAIAYFELITRDDMPKKTLL